MGAARRVCKRPSASATHRPQPAEKNARTKTTTANAIPAAAIPQMIQIAISARERGPRMPMSITNPLGIGGDALSEWAERSAGG
jgi:hypothetical protein